MAQLSLKGVIGIGLGLAAGYFGSRVMEARALGVPVNKLLFTEWNTPVSKLPGSVALLPPPATTATGS